MILFLHEYIPSSNFIPMQTQIQQLQDDVKPLRDKLVNHSLYAQIDSIEDLRLFMEHHVFAVWDFMSLLKSLQKHLTCVDVPWVPIGDASTRYLINEIVTGEESDIDQQGNRVSHFELYLQAMKQTGCNLELINRFIENIVGGERIESALQHSHVNDAITAFVSNTFQTINTGKPHVIAAVFTFGREDLIPGMFISFVRDLNKHTTNSATIFQYYLERHIEVDGDHHSHLAYEMTKHLCGDNTEYWKEATDAVTDALNARINLWDSIVSRL